MINIFEYIDKFFASLQDYNINYNICFIAFVGLFLLTIFGVIIATSKSYESKLTKAVDSLNNYFLQNPSINEENLVSFNNRLKSKKIPKQLRKSWQQFVLYREGKASEYMSFENCVTKPIQNSSYKRSIGLMNILAWIFSIMSLLINFYVSYETDIVTVLAKVFVTPAIILLLNFLITMFLNFRHNAIKSDLYQNYQYFEVNIDKATKTLPEYVDYEVLFDRNEIKRGIPILYSYLQKRAEEEQRELELARLKNVEHEKFNFEEAGVAGSLVLERAMQEAENYIAERKKYNQDTEQVNADMTQEDLNFREITKEYNRQMQVSKETFANFKSQLDEASSSIEANYIKKQQQQELDRQRNLERDYDTATERHKKIIESFHAELDAIDGFRAQSRKTLENAMMSEFDTYSTKVYDEAKKAVDEREKDKYEKTKKQIKNLEEDLVNKKLELEQLYYHVQVLSEKLEKAKIPIPVQINQLRKGEQFNQEEEDSQQGVVNQYYQPEPVQLVEEEPEEVQYFEPVEETQPEEAEFEESLDEEVEQPQGYQPLTYEDTSVPEYLNEEVEEVQYFEPVEEAQPEEAEFEEFSDEEVEQPQAYKPLTYEESSVPEYLNEEPTTENLNNDSDFEEFNFDEVENVNSEEGLAEDNQTDSSKDYEEFDFDAFEKSYNETNKDESDEEPKDESDSEGEEGFEEFEEFDLEEDEDFEELEEDEEESDNQSSFSTNKSESEMSGVTKRKAGRPRKILTEEELNRPKRKAGRPRKVLTEEELNKPKRKPGRPKKSEAVKKEKRGPGRPKKSFNAPKKQEEISVDKYKNLDDIDAYLKEIDDVIAQENAKFEASKKELEERANIKNKK